MFPTKGHLGHLERTAALCLSCRLKHGMDSNIIHSDTVAFSGVKTAAPPEAHSAATLWCMHPDCTESVECFETESYLATHMQTAHESLDESHSSSPASVNAVDIAPQVLTAQAAGGSAFKKLRKSLNGDGSLQYSVDPATTVRLTAKCWATFERLTEASINDNRERAFIVIIDEQQRLGIDCLISTVGDENGCVFTPDALLEASRQAPAGTRLAFGHTHPVWWTNPTIGDWDLTGEYPRKFGAMPSNIMVGLKLWTEAVDDLTTGAALSMNRIAASQIIAKTIHGPRLYKTHGADFCQFLCHHTPGYLPEEIGAISQFEFIFSPRLRQLGVFRPLPPNKIEYVPWEVMNLSSFNIYKS